MADDDRSPTADPFASARQQMVQEQLVARGIRDPATLAAMGLVPRERFVPEGLVRRAYHDGALAIGRGQTISQPYMVALMTQALALAEQGWPWSADAPTLLDVGTGSGYQAAILAQLGARVVSIERDPELADRARERLASLGYGVHVVVGDGSEGSAENGPYAGIVVGAAAPAVPEPLMAQLEDGARLVVPVGSRETQRLMVVGRTGDRYERQGIEDCVFVPLVGRHGYPG
jgi:protein-L-isoaspartate(D-aspartate) O-methyltransferase